MAKAKAKADSPAASMEANLKEKTGKSIESWVKELSGSKDKKHGEIVAMLKSTHGLGHGYANLIAHRLRESSAEHSDAADLVAAQYADKKAGLRPIYDRIIETVGGFGSDVEVAPKKAYVSLRRKKQFAIVQPSTATRVDLGINLKGRSATDRLEASGSFNSMVSHRVRLESPKDVDAEVKKWLKEAYEGA